jgi:hypothetical protein
MSYPSVTVVRYSPAATITMIVAEANVVNRWAPEPAPPGGDPSGWLFNDADNSAHMMLTWD